MKLCQPVRQAYCKVLLDVAIMQRGSCPQSVNSELFFLYVAFSLLVSVGLYPISCVAITLNYSIENISPSVTYILTHNNVHNTPANYLLYGFGL